VVERERRRGAVGGRSSVLARTLLVPGAVPVREQELGVTVLRLLPGDGDLRVRRPQALFVQSGDHRLTNAIVVRREERRPARPARSDHARVLELADHVRDALARDRAGAGGELLGDRHTDDRDVLEQPPRVRRERAHSPPEDVVELDTACRLPVRPLLAHELVDEERVPLGLSQNALERIVRRLDGVGPAHLQEASCEQLRVRERQLADAHRLRQARAFYDRARDVEHLAPHR